MRRRSRRGEQLGGCVGFAGDGVNAELFNANGEVGLAVVRGDCCSFKISARCSYFKADPTG